MEAPLILPPELWEHQKILIPEALKDRYFALFHEAGCVAGYVKIKINRGGCSREYTMEEFFKSFNNVETFKNTNSKKVKAKSYIRSWLGDRFGLNEVKKVLRSGEKEVFRLTHRGQPNWIDLTADHEVMTQRGWTKVEDLIPGQDSIALDRLRRHQSKKIKATKIKLRYVNTTVGLHHPYARHVNAGVDRRGWKHPATKRMEGHRVVYEAFLNGLTVEQFKDKLHSSFSSSKLKFVDPSRFHIHHKNGKTKDNRIENLEMLSAFAHWQVHGNYGHFGHGGISWSKIVSVKPMGISMTYDIACTDPHRNFVANGAVIHNSGKTLSMITIMRNIFTRHKRPLKTLILCPAVVVDNWEREINRWSNCGQWVEKLQGKKLDRRARLDNPAKKIFVTNFEALDMDGLFWEAHGPKKDRKLIKHGFELLIVDESHRLKNHSASRTKLLIRMADTIAYRYILTGTPLLNKLFDFWAQLRILDGGKRLGQNFYSFRNEYFIDKNSAMPSQKHFPDWIPKPLCEAKIKAAVDTCSSRVLKKDCLSLPPLIESRIYVDLSGDQAKAYESMKRDYIAYIENHARKEVSKSVATIALTKILRLLQICSGFMVTDEEETVAFKHNPKIVALEDLLEDTAGKVIVWANFKHNYKMIADVCDKLGKSYAFITGEQSGKVKATSEKDFTKGDIEVLISNPQAGGIGINLVEAPTSIWFSRSYSWGDRVQATARNYRGGSEMHEKVHSIDLVAARSIDGVVLEALAGKQNLSDMILDIKNKI